MYDHMDTSLLYEMDVLTNSCNLPCPELREDASVEGVEGVKAGIPSSIDGGKEEETRDIEGVEGETDPFPTSPFFHRLLLHIT